MTDMVFRRFWESLLFGNPREISEPETEMVVKTLEQWEGCCAVCVHTDIIWETKHASELRTAVSAFARECAGLWPVELVFQGWTNELLVLLLKGAPATLGKKQLESCLMQLAAGIRHQHPCHISVGRIVTEWRELQESYFMAADMIDYAVLTEKTVFFAQDLPEPHYDRSCRVLKGRLEGDYMRAVVDREFTVAFHLLERIVEQELDEDMRSVRRLKYRLLSRVECAMQSMGITADDPGEQSKCRELFSQAASQSSLRALLSATEKLYGELDKEARHQLSQDKGKPGDVLTFLEKHYSDPALDSTMVAEACGVSKSYISRIVNRYGGSSFTDYVSALRIGAVKELLKTTSLTVDEICGRVGYTNRWTLLRAFKRFVGMTPQEYRRYSESIPV